MIIFVYSLVGKVQNRVQDFGSTLSNEFLKGGNGQKVVRVVNNKTPTPTFRENL